MIREIRKITNKSKCGYIRMLQYRGKLTIHKNELGYVCYDTEEYKKYKATCKQGRPIKEKS